MIYIKNYLSNSQGLVGESNGCLSFFVPSGERATARFTRRTNGNLGREEEGGLQSERASIVFHLSHWEHPPPLAENYWFRGYAFSREKFLSSIFY